jgi:hypothetical protein
MDRQARDEWRARRGPSHGGLRTGAAGPMQLAVRFPPFAPFPPVAHAAHKRETRDPPETSPTALETTRRVL